jgi:hypothetical protein
MEDTKTWKMAGKDLLVRYWLIVDETTSFPKAATLLGNRLGWKWWSEADDRDQAKPNSQTTLHSIVHQQTSSSSIC